MTSPLKDAGATRETSSQHEVSAVSPGFRLSRLLCGAPQAGAGTDVASDRVDWSQLWYPGPTRVFTAEEMARAGADAPSATLKSVVMVNVALLGFMMLQLAPPHATALLTAQIAGIAMLAGAVSLRLWRQPHRRPLARLSTLAIALILVLTIPLALHFKGDPAIERWVLALGVGSCTSLSIVWLFLTLYRSHQIASRLREQDEQQRALDMARQLAAAQIQPHFLFNSLASLQHWVQTKDDRAAPLLQSLTGFLRATLPLFNRERLALGDEAQAAREYLAVMQLRLGERLRYTLDISPEAAATQVPPGLLLTLVENAVEHGVMPSLSGAEVRVTARCEQGRLHLSVSDTGPGLPAEPTEGVGLTNSRARLRQAFGPEARLTLDNAPAGGCTASLVVPLNAS